MTSPGLGVTMRLLALEAAALQACRALAEAGVPVVLVKGPVTNSWLYGGPDARAYRDVDLLVHPDDAARAGSVLAGLGYVDGHVGQLGVHRPANERAWVRGSTVLDLHVWLAGIPPRRAPGAVRLLLDRAVPFALQTTTVPSLDPVARAVHLGLHAAQSAHEDKALADLRRGLALLAAPEWAAAAALAAELGTTPAFAAGLARCPEGRAVAAALGLTGAGARDLHVRLRVAGALPETLALAGLASLPRDLRRETVRGWLSTADGSRPPLRSRLAALARIVAAAGQLAWLRLIPPRARQGA